MDEGEPVLAAGGEGPQEPRGATPETAEREEAGVKTPGDTEARVCKGRLVEALRGMSAVHSEGLTVWRDTLRECAALLSNSPPGGDDLQHADSFSDLLQSAGEEIEEIMGKLQSIVTRLETALVHLPTEDASPAKDPGTPAQPGDTDVDPPERGGDDRTETTDLTTSRSDRRDAGESEEEVGGQVSDSVEESVQRGTDSQKETEKDPQRSTEDSKEETRSDWRAGLTGQQQDGHPGVCFIKAPAGAPAALRCEAADALSCLMVAGSEELLSRVIRVRARDGAVGVGFPVTVAVPFQARYRGNYRDVAVKVVDEERRASYITPLTTEGLCGGQRGSLAEVKVYSLGLFAVVSCLKRENYTVPKRGLSLKVVMDPRICLNYLPGSFAAPVMAQTMVQPLEAVLLTAVKSRNEAYGSVVSTSPLLHLTHPTSQPLRRPLSVTLPCPPNPDKKRGSRGQRDAHDRLTGAVKTSNTERILGASGKAKETCSESLAVLGLKEDQWSILDKVSARNQQNGLVSFDLTENLDRLLVVRLLSPTPPCVLAGLAEELEASVCCHSVAVVLQRRQDEPHAVLLAAVPSKDLGWELGRLRARGEHGGGTTAVDASPEVSMCEADQLLLRFSGNITSRGSHAGGDGSDRGVASRWGEGGDGAQERLTFHSQRRNQLLLHLTEVDPFGNFSSPHYKGTLLVYRVTRGQLEWRGDAAVLKDGQLLGEPVCRLSLTLPKKVRKINRPIAARVKLCEETGDSLSDSLLLWLSGELSEEEVSLLAVSLRLRRSAAQMVRLRAGDGSSSRAFQLLAAWRRGLPAVPRQPKASQLARCLTKSGRPDLARELLLRQAATSRQNSLG